MRRRRFPILLRLILTAGLLSPMDLGQLDCPRPAAAADVVINEIHYHPASDLEMEEFIELWNCGATTATLDGWAFDDGIQFTFPAGTTLGPDRYLVVAKDPATLGPLAPAATILGPWTGGLQNDGETIRLVNHLGQVIDQLRYNDVPPWPTTPDGQGASLERISPHAPSDMPDNWTAASISAGSQWIRITQTGPATSSRLYIYLSGPGEVLLDDVQVTREGTQTNLVRNPSFEEPFAGGDGSAGWTDTGNHAATHREQSPDARTGLYLCRIVASAAGGSYTNSLNQYTDPLTTGGPNYTLSFWVKPVTADITILARLSGGGLQVSHLFSEATQTAGQVNSCYQANLAPFVFAVSLAPESPAPTSPVLVSAYIRDPDGVTSATLLYQTLKATTQSAVLRLPMVFAAGSPQVGLWTAEVPAQGDRTLVRFRVEAADSSGSWRLSPDPTEARLTYSYLHYADDIASSIPVALLYQYGPDVPQESLRGNAAFVIRPLGEPSPGQRRWQVFDHLVRTNRDNGHNVFFLNHYEWDGMSSINVIFDEKARYALAEYLSFEVHRALGSLSEKAGHLRFFYNDNPRGYQLLFEQPNKTFLGRSGLDNDGNLYKIDYRQFPWVKKTNLTLGDDDIRQLRDQLSTRTGSDLTSYILHNIAVEQVIKYYVGCQLTSDWDGYFNNHFLYHDFEDTGLWYKMPWDKDKTWGDNDAYASHPAPDGYGYTYPVYDMPLLFGANGTPRSGLDNGTWWRNPGWLSGPFLADPTIRRIFYKRLEDATLHMFTTEIWFPIIDALEDRLENEVLERARIYGFNATSDLAVFRNDIQSLRNQVVNRRAFILGAVNPYTYPSVRAVQPLPESALMQAPGEVMVSFTEPINATTVRADTFRLVRSGGDGLFGQPNDVPITPASPPGLITIEQARLHLQGLNLPPDRYRITLAGSGPTPIRDTVGNALDGEFAGTFPSGDYAAGGDFISEFVLLPGLSASARPHWRFYR